MIFEETIMKPNLKKRMYAGYWGNTYMEGEPPIHIELALRQAFTQVTTERLPGAWNLYEYEFLCYDANGDLRLKVQYDWTGNGWQYQPVAVRR